MVYIYICVQCICVFELVRYTITYIFGCELESRDVFDNSVEELHGHVRRALEATKRQRQVQVTAYTYTHNTSS